MNTSLLKKSAIIGKHLLRYPLYAITGMFISSIFAVGALPGGSRGWSPVVPLLLAGIGSVIGAGITVASAVTSASVIAPGALLASAAIGAIATPAALIIGGGLIISLAMTKEEIGRDIQDECEKAAQKNSPSSVPSPLASAPVTPSLSGTFGKAQAPEQEAAKKPAAGQLKPPSL